MKEKTKKIVVNAFLFAAALAYFILAVFVFEAPDGAIGCILCMASACTMIISAVRLEQYTSGKSFGESFVDSLVMILFS